jgi:hypothetical protein
MRRTILIASLILMPVAAAAQDASPLPPAGAAPQVPYIVPMPREEAGVSGYRILAITAGAVVGVVVANFLTGGMITPILAAGTGAAMPAMAAPAVAVVEPAVVAGAAAVPAAAAAAPAAAAAVVEPVVAAGAAAVPEVAGAVAAVPAAAASVAAPVVAATSYGMAAVQTGVLVVGAVVGGYVGNWFYGK